MTSTAAALDALAEHRLDGAWIDLRLGADRDAGFKVLDAIAGRLPCVVVTGRHERRLANRAAARGALFMQKPVTREELAPWISRMLRTPAGEALLAARVVALAKEWRLSAAQEALFVALMKQEEKATYIERLEISPHTYERHVSALLARAKASTRAGLVIDVLLGLVLS